MNNGIIQSGYRLIRLMHSYYKQCISSRPRYNIMNAHACIWYIPRMRTFSQTTLIMHLTQDGRTNISRDSNPRPSYVLSKLCLYFLAPQINFHDIVIALEDCQSHP